MLLSYHIVAYIRDRSSLVFSRYLLDLFFYVFLGLTMLVSFGALLDLLDCSGLRKTSSFYNK